MNDKQVLVMPGDGIGPEVIKQARGVLEAINEKYDLGLSIVEAPLGGSAVDQHGEPYPEVTRDLARESRGILLGAVGGPTYDSLPREKRPERGLLAIRADLDLFANLRPAILFPELADASSLKPEVVSGLDILIVRELTGGIYFGGPRGVRELEDGQREGFNTYKYSESEINRIGKVAFELAQKRGGRLCSVDKANVLEATELWKECISKMGAEQFADVELSHMYVDNAAMQLVRAPKQFDVLVTGNMFGDILSDEAAMLTGSIGMLPSASLNEQGQGLYEPCHGSAPDIAGQDKANPLATILSVAMMMRYSFDHSESADAIEQAVQSVLASGLRTADIALGGESVVGTEAMGKAVIERL